MSDNVIAIKGVVKSDAKAAMLDLMAQAWDNFKDEHEVEPEATLFVLLSPAEERLAFKTGWEIGAAFHHPGWSRMIINFAGDLLKRGAMEEIDGA